MRLFNIPFGGALLYGLLLGCSGNKMQEQADTLKMVLKTDGLLFDTFVLSYTPHHIDISIDLNDTLSYFNAKLLFDNATESQKQIWTSILLLKQYLHHLKRANQGYDLYSMRKGETALIINEFIGTNNLDSDGEFLNSGYVVDIVIKDKLLSKNESISMLLKEIKNEEKRIATKSTY